LEAPNLTPFLLVSILLLHKKNKNFPEDLHEINEEVQGVGNEVSVSSTSLEDDELGIVHDETAEDGKSKIDMNLHNKCKN
jgi:hypothetical protein